MGAGEEADGEREVAVGKTAVTDSVISLKKNRKRPMAVLRESGKRGPKYGLHNVGLSTSFSLLLAEREREREREREIVGCSWIRRSRDIAWRGSESAEEI